MAEEQKLVAPALDYQVRSCSTDKHGRRLFRVEAPVPDLKTAAVIRDFIRDCRGRAAAFRWREPESGQEITARLASDRQRLPPAGGIWSVDFQELFGE